MCSQLLTNVAKCIQMLTDNILSFKLLISSLDESNRLPGEGVEPSRCQLRRLVCLPIAPPWQDFRMERPGVEPGRARSSNRTLCTGRRPLKGAEAEKSQPLLFLDVPRGVGRALALVGHAKLVVHIRESDDSRRDRVVPQVRRARFNDLADREFTPIKTSDRAEHLTLQRALFPSRNDTVRNTAHGTIVRERADIVLGVRLPKALKIGDVFLESLGDLRLHLQELIFCHGLSISDAHSICKLQR